MSTAYYCRVSTDTQEQAQTIEAQLHLIRAYLQTQGITATAYVDDGVTGMLELHERPAGSELIAAAKLGQITRLVVYKLDRLGRGNDARLLLNAVYGLRDLGVSVVSLTEMIDTGTPSGELFLGMLASFASYERKVFLERSRLGTERVARLGKWLGGIVPFGYRVDDDGYLQISEEPIPGCEYSEAGVIRLMYHLAADEGWTCLKIAQYLNGLKIPTKYAVEGRQITRGKRKVNTSGQWRPGRIRNTLVEPTYKGEHTYGRRSTKRKETITREVPAIVDPATWEAAQDTLRGNFIEAMRNQKRHYLLRGLIKCAKCGRTYHGTAFPGNRDRHLSASEREKVPYYICGGKQKGAIYPDQPCNAKNLKADEIEGHVWRECVRILTEPAAAMAYLQANQPDLPDAHDDAREARALVSALEENSRERERVVTLYRRALIDDDELTAQLRQVDGEREAIRQRQDELGRRLRQQQTREDETACVQSVLKKLRPLLELDDFDARRKIVTTLVDHITVTTLGEGVGNQARWHVRAEVEICYRVAELAKVVI